MDSWHMTAVSVMDTGRECEYVSICSARKVASTQ